MLRLAHLHRQNRAKKRSDDWLGRCARTRGRWWRRGRRALRLKRQFQIVEVGTADRKCAVVVLSADRQFV